MIDIHCHLLPALDDGPPDWPTSLRMARIAVDDGIQTVIATPHQLGNYRRNSGDIIRQLTADLQRQLRVHHIALDVRAGADVRIEPEMISGVRSREILTLADQGRHILLELPHELYFPLEPVLKQLGKLNVTGILSHPERNAGILAQPKLVPELIERGCLMQVTAASFLGAFGDRSQRFAEWMLDEQLIHFVATDAHGDQHRRPRLGAAFRRIALLASVADAERLCQDNPSRLVDGRSIVAPKPSMGAADTFRTSSARKTIRPRRRRWFGLRVSK